MEKVYLFVAVQTDRFGFYTEFDIKTVRIFKTPEGALDELHNWIKEQLKNDPELYQKPVDGIAEYLLVKDENFAGIYYKCWVEEKDLED